MGQSGGQLVRFVKFMWVFFFCGKIRLRSIAKKKKKIFTWKREKFFTLNSRLLRQGVFIFTRVCQKHNLHNLILKKKNYQLTRGHLATVNMSSFLLRPTVRFSIKSHSFILIISIRVFGYMAKLCRMPPRALLRSRRKNRKTRDPFAVWTWKWEIVK